MRSDITKCPLRGSKIEIVIVGPCTSRCTNLLTQRTWMYLIPMDRKAHIGATQLMSTHIYNPFWNAG